MKTDQMSTQNSYSVNIYFDTLLTIYQYLATKTFWS